MLNLFEISKWNELEVLTFFMVIVRISVLFSVLPIIGDRVVPAQVKVLLSLAVALMMFPTLMKSGALQPQLALEWSTSLPKMILTVGAEVGLALLIGFTSQVLFNSIAFGANLVGGYMGFAAASTYDPHQESQTQVIAQLQTTLAMLVFLAVEGHHLMLSAALQSFYWVGIGQASLTQVTAEKLIYFTAQSIRLGLQLSAPVAFAIFSVNTVFGILSKAMPQLNVLVLSFAVTALVGLLVMFLSVPEFQGVSSSILGQMAEWTQIIAVSTQEGK